MTDPTEALARQKERDELLALIDAVSQRDHPPRTEWQSGYSVAMAEFRAILSRPIEQAAEDADGVTRGSLAAPPPSAAADLDARFLDWLADRLVHVYGESENVDFVRKLRAYAAARAAK